MRRRMTKEDLQEAYKLTTKSLKQMYEQTILFFKIRDDFLKQQNFRAAVQQEKIIEKHLNTVTKMQKILSTYKGKLNESN